MFNYIECENFMSLKNIRFSFEGKNNKPKKMIFLYGENGAGKSNVISVFSFLKDTIQNLMLRNKIQDIISQLKSDDDEIETSDNLIELIKSNYPTMKELIQKYKMIGSTGNLKVKYGFQLNGVDGEYEIITDNEVIVKERLYYIVNKKRGDLFSITKDNIYISDYTVPNIKYRNSVIDDIKKYWGQHTLLGIIANYYEVSNKNYINGEFSRNLIDVFGFFFGTSVDIKGSSGYIGTSHEIFGQITNGTIDKSEEYELNSLEILIRDIFTNLYSDIKDIYYVRKDNDNKIEYKLYVKKLVGGEILNIDFKLESTGTKRILELIPMFVEGIKGNTVIVDEIDTGIHDLMMKGILNALNEAIQGQIIVTTHNTLLMDSLPSESVYFININQDGEKKILCLDDYERIQPNHSVRNRYLKGTYDGIPYINDIDFDEIVYDYESRLKESKKR